MSLNGAAATHQFFHVHIANHRLRHALLDLLGDEATNRGYEVAVHGEAS